MGKYSRQLIGATSDYRKSLEAGREEKDIESLSRPAKDVKPGMLDMFTGESRETPEISGLPEFRETEEATGAKGTDSIVNTMKMTAGLMFTLDDQSSQDIIQENIPNAKFEKDEKGNTIIDIDGKKSVLNKPGWSGQDSVRALTQVLAFVTPAKLAGMASRIITKMGIGAAGAGVTEAGIQEIEKMAGSKEERTLGRIVGATVLGGAAEGAGPAWRGVKKARQAKRLQVAKADIADVAGSVKEARGAEKATGIDLAFPQKTAVPAQLEEMSFVAALPAGTKKSMQFLRKQNVQASEGVEAYLNALAPPDAIIKGAEKFRDAAQLAVKAKKQIRKEAVSPIYKKAFQDNTGINPKEIVDSITAKLDDFPEGGEVAKTLGKIKGLLTPKKKGEEVINPTLKKLHNAKLEIDQMISSYGENSLGNTTKKEVLEIKDALLSYMDEASPGYKTAREEFSRLSPDVTKIQESIIGKMADISDVQLKTISRRIFDPAETNVHTIRNAKKVINSVDPEAWNGLLRVEIERRMGSMASDLSEAGVGAVENVPGQLYRAIFKPSKQRNVLMAALDGDQKANLKYLETALKRASLGRPGGSQTAAREEIKRRLKGGIVQGIRDFFGAPLKTTAAIGEEAAYNQRVRNLSEILFNPEYKIKMNKIRKMNPNSSAALKAFTQLLNESGEE